MRYGEIEKVEELLKKEIEHINEFEIVDHYVEQYYANGLGMHNEYWDNTLDTSYHYKMIKEIQADERFMAKLRFVLDNFVHQPKED